MLISRNALLQAICCGALFAAVPQAVTLAAAQTVVAGTGLPDSPGATSTAATIQFAAVKMQSGAPQEDPNQATPSSASQSQTQPPPTQPAAPQSPPSKPVGTAAAGAIPSTGIAASQPAGVAIAPAKQHRVRNIVIRTGAIIGAGIAVGTVVALSEGTSSKPPGAH